MKAGTNLISSYRTDIRFTNIFLYLADLIRMVKQVVKSFLKKFLSKKDGWSIGIYTGKSPTHLRSPQNINNPVLTAGDVTDIPAQFVADPFMVREDGIWYMFFEVLNQLDGLGDIALATSRNGFDWGYRCVVLDEPFHLSYPYVFKWNDDYYMIPETSQKYSIRLYQAVDFPTHWKLIKILVDGDSYVDSSIFFLSGTWWMFTSSTANNCLRLYHANELIGPWVEHCKSPLIVKNKGVARPAGRVVVQNGQIIRFAQDCRWGYGTRVCAFHIKELTTTCYREERQKGSVVGKNGFGWARNGMHTVDPHRIDHKSWLACVDGNHQRFVLNVGSKFKT